MEKYNEYLQQYLEVLTIKNIVLSLLPLIFISFLASQFNIKGFEKMFFVFLLSFIFYNFIIFFLAHRIKRGNYWNKKAYQLAAKLQSLRETSLSKVKLIAIREQKISELINEISEYKKLNSEVIKHNSELEERNSEVIKHNSELEERNSEVIKQLATFEIDMKNISELKEKINTISFKNEQLVSENDNLKKNYRSLVNKINASKPRKKTC